MAGNSRREGWGREGKEEKGWERRRRRNKHTHTLFVPFPHMGSSTKHVRERRREGKREDEGGRGIKVVFCLAGAATVQLSLPDERHCTQYA